MYDSLVFDINTLPQCKSLCSNSNAFSATANANAVLKKVKFWMLMNK